MSDFLSPREFKNAIDKLKKKIAKKGLFENAGQKELSGYHDWLFTNLSYQEACKEWDKAVAIVDKLNEDFSN